MDLNIVYKIKRGLYVYSNENFFQHVEYHKNLIICMPKKKRKKEKRKVYGEEMVFF